MFTSFFVVRIVVKSFKKELMPLSDKTNAMAKKVDIR